MEKYTSTDEQVKLERAMKRVKALSGFYQHLIAYLLVNVFLLAMKWFQLDPGETLFDYRNFMTAFFWGFGLLCHAAAVFGRNMFLGSDWEERKIREIMDKDNKKRWE